MSGPGVNAVYTDNIPFSSNNPSNDQPIMEQNTNSINSVLSVDHIAFNTPNSIGGNLQGGYHTIIHQPFRTIAAQTAWNAFAGSGVPAAVKTTAITGVNQTFSMNYTPDTTGGTADTQLFSMTGGSGISQLTGNHTSDLSGGWCWVGGILLQWGNFASSLTTDTVTFKDRNVGAIPFPNNCFGVVMQNVGNTAPIYRVFSFTKAQFIWVSSVAPTAFFWVAIGN